MLQEILKAVPTYFSDLQTAVKAKDWGEMVYHAHRLKGTTATAGIDRVPTWLAELEEAIPLKDFDLIQTRMTQIETMLAKAMQFVEQKLQS
jgi:HPt (histidine-containing phosphotransfer) domain-containing protein